MKTRILLLAAAAGSLAGGCASEQSYDVPTEAMAMDLDAVDRGTGDIAVTVTLTTRSPGALITYVDLEGGDRLLAKVGAESQELRERELLDIYNYNAVFSEPTDSLVEVAFIRTAGTSAFDTAAELPLPFAIDAAPADHARGFDYELSWEAPGDAAYTEVSVHGPCITGSLLYLDGDPGFATIEAEAFDAPEDAEDPEALCDFALEVRRSVEGVLDPAFGYGGSVEATQEREVTVALTE